MAEALKIIFFSIGAAVIYGILHDQVTAHLCVEYFTIAHPPAFPTQSPFWLAIGWGIIATWWVGLALGLALAVAARFGPSNKFGLKELRPAIIKLMLVSAICALLAGLAGALAGSAGLVLVADPLATLIPQQKHVAFLTALWAHSASYLVGAAGGLFVIGRTIWLRVR